MGLKLLFHFTTMCCKMEKGRFTLPCFVLLSEKPEHVVLLPFSHHSVLWMDHLFNLLQLPQHWPRAHPHHQQALQGWLHSYWWVHRELRHAVMNSEKQPCQSFQFKALTHSAEYFMMSGLRSVIISIEREQQNCKQHQIEFLYINHTEINWWSSWRPSIYA